MTIDGWCNFFMILTEELFTKDQKYLFKRFIFGATVTKIFFALAIIMANYWVQLIFSVVILRQQVFDILSKLP